MATLTCENLSFRFSFDGLDDDWTRCSFGFYWQDHQLVRSELAKDWARHCQHPEGDFLADLDVGEPQKFMAQMREILDTGVAGYWESMEPAITVAIHPGLHFPLLPSHQVVIKESSARLIGRDAREKLKRKFGKLPDDLFNVMIRVDAYNFRNGDCYYGSGLILQMLASRIDLEAFVTALEQEHARFVLENRIGPDGYSIKI